MPDPGPLRGPGMIGPLPGDIFRQGQVLNHTYEIEGVLGRGGTGEVYRAKNQISGRIVAIKALNARFSGNDDYIQLMRREEQMRDVLNDAVVRYTECSRTDQGHVFLVMDFIDGPSMNDVMARRRMDARELMIIAHRVAEGLVAAHARGIVHRDLSPDNVVLRDGEAGRATIIDFGIAKDTSTGAKTIVGNEFAGKYEYAAPEQLEGRAEKRSDLYALGATLLAAFRGQVPFAGSTPGEIVRRKQSRLDTEGVPEPLKGLIDWLTAPALADRAPSAEAVVARLNEVLRPNARRAGRQAPHGGESRKRGNWALLLVLLLGLAGGGAWYAGLFEGWNQPVLPVAAPYLLTASAGPQGAALSGNAPDAGSAQRLRQAFAGATGTTPPETALTLATGVPDDRWVENVAAGLGQMQGLAEWALSVTDNTLAVTGLADSRDLAADRTTAISDWAGQAGMTARIDIAIGPRLLPVQAVRDVVQPFALCGPLGPDAPPEAGYALGDTIVITGAIETEAARGKLQQALEDAIGDRQLRIDATILNADLCAVRRVLPQLESDRLSIWLGDGATGQVNLSGIYHAGENPVVEVLAPADLTGLSLWVVVVDNTGAVYNLLPNLKQEAHDLADVGAVENGQRRIRVLHSLEDVKNGIGTFATTVDEDSFGKSEIIAFLSKTSLFGIRRPKDESIASFAEALAQILRDEPGNIVSIASRVIDARP
ncbi:serine/threonine-protein kinase [Tabrizicola soli]|uniref:Serine/threonine-protein kinase n=1 Tax=Tabrizicola soli TaxID=2185115 RepID=A0ABV7DW61_9RHOB|nr:serine/threonine-protein kinase [Tabrizicola soli]